MVHERQADEHQRVVWMAEPGRETSFVFVLIAGGKVRRPAQGDFGHLGFALPSREAGDAVARSARQLGALRWPPRQEPYPVGYYCGICDPNGTMIEFSYGQPLGPGDHPDASCV